MADIGSVPQHNISPRYPNFTFQRIDIKSRPYNPGGVLNGSDFRFPFEDASLDLIFMISVLTHVDLATVETYFCEATRTLKPDTGRLVTTTFLLDDEVDALLTAGRGHFRMASTHGSSRVENPELAIAHPRRAVLDILDSAGFAQSTVFNGYWSGRAGVTPMDFQDLLIAGRRGGTVSRLPSQPAMPPRGGDSALQRVCGRIAALADGNEFHLSRFFTWSNAVTLSAFWWLCDGLTLALAGEASTGADRWHLDFDRLRKLGLEKIRPLAVLAVA